MAGPGTSFLRDLYDLAKEKDNELKSGEHGFLFNALIRIFKMDTTVGTAASEASLRSTILGRVLVEESLESAEIADSLSVLLCRLYTGFIVTAINMNQSIERFKEIGTSIGRVSMDSAFSGRLVANMALDVESFFETGTKCTMEGLAMKPADTPTSLEKFQVSQYYDMEFKVDIGGKADTVKLPIQVVLLPGRLTYEAVRHIVKNGNPENLFRRLIKVIIGEINPFLDFLLCRDLIKQQGQAIKQDKNNVLVSYYDDLLTKKRKTLTNLFTGRVQNNLANSILVVDENTLKDICHEASINLLESRSDIQKFMEENFMIMLAVVDQSHGLVTIHINAINDPIEIGFERLKTLTSGKGGVSVEQLTKVLAMGNAPRF